MIVPFIGKARAEMTYEWQLLANPSGVPAADGVAAVRMSNGNILMHGGIWTQPLSGLYKGHESNPAAIALHDTLPNAGRHTHIMLEGPWDGRAYGIGGDPQGGYEAEIFSVDVDGNDFRIDLSGVPGLDCALFYAFRKGNYFYWGGGQQFASVSGTPRINLPLYRWGGPGTQVELVLERVPHGARGIYSGPLPELNGKHFWVGGAVYEDAGCPRFHQNDVVSIDANLEIETVNPLLEGLDVIWHNAVAWDDKLWQLLGHRLSLGSGSDGDTTNVRYSPDGETWATGPSFPGTKRHAAVALPISSGILVTTGSHSFYDTANARDMWLLTKDIYTYGQKQNGTTGWGIRYTIADRSVALPNNALISQLQIKFNNAHNGVYYKILRENSPGSFDVIYDSGPVSHPGGGYAGVSPNVTIPSSGVYRMGVSADLPSSPAEVFANGPYNRSMNTGNMSGNGIALTPISDGTICMRFA